MDIWTIIVAQWQEQSIWEVFAVGFAVAYVWLASEESLWCWPSGFIATTLYAYVYWDVTLVFQMLLNIYYMAMAIWGFVSWRKKDENSINITRMSLKMHIKLIVIGILASLATLLISSIWLEYKLIALDIIVTVFSLLATYLTVRKKLENWVYWTVINIVSIYLLLETGLYLSIVLMFLYVCIAIKGFYQWFQSYNQKANYAS